MFSRMDVVFFMQDTGGVFGAERATLDLAFGLRQAGIVPHFFLLQEQRIGEARRDLRSAIEEDGFSLTLFPVRGRFSWQTARDVGAAFRRLGGNVLHVVGYKANLHARVSGVRPIVTTVHGWLYRSDWKEKLYAAIERYCLRRCDAVVCLSSHYERVLQDAGVSPARLRRIPSGLRRVPAMKDLESNPVRGEGVITFGMMGRFSEEKRHEDFLEAAAQVSQRQLQARFLIAGNGHLETDIRQAIQRRGLGRVVELKAYTPVDAFMCSIDVYVICSAIENLPYSILEAMAWARPIIGTRVGGIPDLVEDGINGRLVSSHQPAELSAAMASFVQNPDDAIAMGRKGRVRLASSFTLQASVAAHVELYNSLVGMETGL